VSQENVDTMRGIYADWGRGRFSSGVELFDPHVMLVLRSEFPDAGVYVGPEQIAGYMRELFTAWTHFAIEGETFVDAGDTVLVGVRQRGTGPASQVETEIRYFQAWTFRGGAIVRIESIRERAQALEAVGLRDRGSPPAAS
jgi:ketosteroid isomerase-like protein